MVYTFTSDQVLQAIVTAIACALAGIPAMFPISHKYIQFYMLEPPIWAGFNSILDFKSCLLFFLRGVVGTWLATAMGCLLHLILSSICAACGIEYFQIWAMVIALPLTYFVALSHPDAGCKLSEIISYVTAIISLYVPIAINITGHPYLEALWNAILVSYGLLCGFIPVLVLYLLDWLPSPSANPLQKFNSATADYFDVLSAYVVSGAENLYTIDAHHMSYDKSLVAASAYVKDDKLRSIIWRMASALYSLRKSITAGTYDDVIVEALWRPMSASLLELRSQNRAVLRAASGNVPTAGDVPNLMSTAVRCKESLNEASMVMRKSIKMGTVKALDTEGITRFHFAIESILRYAELAEEYSSVTAQLRGRGVDQDEGEVRWWVALCTATKELTSWAKGWWSRPVFYDDGQSRAEHLLFPLKASLATTIAIIVLFPWGNSNASVNRKFLWIYLAACYCVLPVAGACLLKIGRSLVGLVGALLYGLICVEANPFNHAAFFLELIILGFVGGFVKATPLSYAGSVFILTWTIVAFTPSVALGEAEGDILWGLGWRCALNLVGMGIAFVFSCVFFPVYAISRLQHVSASALECAGNSIQDALDQLASVGLAVEEEVALEDGREEVGRELSGISNRRASLVGDAHAEVSVFGKLFMRVACTKCFQVQPFISEITTAALSAYGATTACALKESSSSQGSLKALGPHLKELSIALGRSEERMVTGMSIACRDATRGALNDDVHVEMLRCLDALDESRSSLDGDDDDGASSLSYALYSLYLFIEEWEYIETFLFGHDESSMRVVELHTRGVPDLSPNSVGDVETCDAFHV
ncbi:hypothetical protein Pmar_PMAR004457 [Perkinsus marinus ATCC 50983]|uniref:Uncharacterized protein n=1 Tax=Perkinsus marinus (strain ATCC 50983 / TXsc) TaxID=423536 RepID=C5LZQ2_PERM5|nr:hypothetical protein Pmar_PMAR004457 [Perkinsus marinus ATCC 50983]EEQ97720.1 hypothetical protein Pmar_PMAR004457 [Perkinsus marinus ATCC 50983]|eukprot:XP_002765003.1 hypothetical protein Pmar_PMAR004457 [Perkinsus marinus ATCC 50983]